MIPIVAIVAVFVALPFYRRLDVTSAYEYLEKRFNRGVRLFGSASFTIFHIFRMAVVLSLTGLALAVATPLTPTQSVLVMGILSILYCTMGGIEAVIWTDTVQTVVLFGGALIALAMLILGIDGGLSGMLESANNADKLRLVNLHWDATSSQIALWVVIVGGIGQNLSSYTADQAVVQRYMTTETQSLAARSIWTNAFLTIPASLLFFGLGTALFAYYQSHPDKLDPSVTSDQIFPLFIAREMPGRLGRIDRCRNFCCRTIDRLDQHEFVGDHGGHRFHEAAEYVQIRCGLSAHCTRVDVADWCPWYRSGTVVYRSRDQIFVRRVSEGDWHVHGRIGRSIRVGCHDDTSQRRGRDRRSIGRRDGDVLDVDVHAGQRLYLHRHRCRDLFCRRVFCQPVVTNFDQRSHGLNDLLYEDGES